MSETKKPQFTVDLDEIDRQLRRSMPSPDSRREPDLDSLASAPPRDPSYDEFQRSDETAFNPPLSSTSRPVFPKNQQDDDPLQELARIVGQEDPFKSIFGGHDARQNLGEIAAPRNEWQDFENQYVSPPQPQGSSIGNSPLRTSPEVGDLASYHRADNGYPPDQDMQGYTANPHQFPYAAETVNAPAGMVFSEPSPFPTEQVRAPQIGAPQISAPQVGISPARPATDYARADYAPAGGVDYEDFNPASADPKLGYRADYDEPLLNSHKPTKPASKNKVLLIAGVAVLAVVAGLGYALFKGKIGGRGEPPLVSASNEPTKVAPQTPGGKEFPDQNKQIYQGGTKEGSTQVVDREEQPVDVKAATGASGANGADNAFGEARRVRTVAVRPDGTIIGDVQQTAPAQNVSRATVSDAVPGQSSVRTPTATALPGGSVTTPVITASPSTQPAQPSRPQTTAQPPIAPQTPQTPQRNTTTIATTQQDASAKTNPPPARPITQPPANQPPANTAVSTGSYAVQFGVSASEAEGKAKFSRLKAQFPDLLGNVAPAVRQAEIDGRTVYRIRTGGMSKEASDTLCNNIKAAGGTCYVARN